MHSTNHQNLSVSAGSNLRDALDKLGRSVAASGTSNIVASRHSQIMNAIKRKASITQLAQPPYTPNFKDAEALCYAVSVDFTGAVKALLWLGANPNVHDSKLAILAADRGSSDILFALIEHGLVIPPTVGRVALQTAVRKGYTVVATTLLDAGVPAVYARSEALVARRSGFERVANEIEHRLTQSVLGVAK